MNSQTIFLPDTYLGDSERLEDRTTIVATATEVENSPLRGALMKLSQ
jgi:hypothetical protein